MKEKIDINNMRNENRNITKDTKGILRVISRYFIKQVLKQIGKS